jgi:CRP-like cAMP-binding protein
VIIQLLGSGQTLDVERFREVADKRPDFRTTLLRHEQALFAQAQQSAACNAKHTVETRLSRWLLRSRDLSGSDTLKLTQEFLAQMIGVQRSSVSLVANTLQSGASAVGIRKCDGSGFGRPLREPPARALPQPS